MSIDYDKLRTDLDEIEAGVHVTTRYTWADLARELLRLRDGVGELVENKLAAAGTVRERIDAGFWPNAFGYAVTATEVTCDELTALLEGDTE